RSRLAGGRRRAGRHHAPGRARGAAVAVGRRLVPRGGGEPGTGLPPITLAHNVASDEEVDAVLERARAAGAREVREAQRRDWGGCSGYVVDPAGYAWEIAHAPGDAAAAAVARNREFARSLAASRQDRWHDDAARADPGGVGRLVGWPGSA